MIVVQTIYWVCTIISLGNIAISYRNSNINYVKYAFVLLTLRNTLRLYNFEQTEEQIALMTGQMCLSFFMIQVFSINFEKTSTNIFIKRVLIIAFVPQTVMKIGQWKFDSILNSLISAFFILATYKLVDLYCDYSE